MPQFNAGSAHTARVVMRNPTTKPLDYKGVLYMGINQATMTEVLFHLNAGESKEVPFRVTMPDVAGTYPVYLGVFSNDVPIPPLYRSTEDVVVVPGYVEVMITSLKYNPINWYASLFNLTTKQFVPAVSGGGIHSLDTPTVFDIPPGPYLLYVHEFTTTGGWWLGPYLANIPATGVYTWNSVAETLNGVKVTSLASLPAGRVTGVLQQRSYEPIGGVGMGWVAQLLIQEATPGTAANYFVGTSVYIKDADFPYYGEHVSIIPAGSVVTGILDMYWSDPAYGTVWRLRNVTYPLEYPSSAYVFSGSIARLSYGKVVISVSGNVSPFRVVKITRDPTSPDYPQAGWWQAASLLGPVSNYSFDDPYIEGSGFIHQLWAHPNPNKVYDALTAGVNHWVKVTEIRT